MVARIPRFSVPVSYSRAPYSTRASSSNSKNPSFHKTTKSTSSYEAAKKVFEANRFAKHLPPGWKERFIVIDEPREPPLSYDDFKQQRLMTFEKFRMRHKKYYDDVTIQKGYEGYCKGSYSSYLIELEQYEPGIIF